MEMHIKFNSVQEWVEFLASIRNEPPPGDAARAATLRAANKTLADSRIDLSTAVGGVPPQAP